MRYSNKDIAEPHSAGAGTRRICAGITGELVEKPARDQ